MQYFCSCRIPLNRHSYVDHQKIHFFPQFIPPSCSAPSDSSLMLCSILSYFILKHLHYMNITFYRETSFDRPTQMPQKSGLSKQVASHNFINIFQLGSFILWKILTIARKLKTKNRFVDTKLIQPNMWLSIFWQIKCSIFDILNKPFTLSETNKWRYN